MSRGLAGDSRPKRPGDGGNRSDQKQAEMQKPSGPAALAVRVKIGHNKRGLEKTRHVIHTEADPPKMGRSCLAAIGLKPGREERMREICSRQSGFGAEPSTTSCIPAHKAGSAMILLRHLWYGWHLRRGRRSLFCSREVLLPICTENPSMPTAETEENLSCKHANSFPSISPIRYTSGTLSPGTTFKERGDRYEFACTDT